MIDNRTNPSHPRYTPGFKQRFDVYGYAAIKNCSKLGNVIYVSVKGGPWLSYQVVDCQYWKDWSWMKEVLVEINYSAAVATGTYPYNSTARCRGC